MTPQRSLHDAPATVFSRSSPDLRTASSEVAASRRTGLIASGCPLRALRLVHHTIRVERHANHVARPPERSAAPVHPAENCSISSARGVHPAAGRRAQHARPRHDCSDYFSRLRCPKEIRGGSLAYGQVDLRRSLALRFPVPAPNSNSPQLTRETAASCVCVHAQAATGSPATGTSRPRTEPARVRLRHARHHVESVVLPARSGVRHNPGCTDRIAAARARIRRISFLIPYGNHLRPGATRFQSARETLARTA